MSDEIPRTPNRARYVDLPEPGSPTNTTMRICDHHIVPRNWDQHYADLANVDSNADPLLIEAAEMLPPARALDLACGPGRHALYLARLGWHVTAVDSSAVAIALLRERAVGLPIEARLADLERGAFGIVPNGYQLICDFLYLQRDLFPQIREGIHPGGIFAGAIHLFQEGCSATPCNPAFLLQPGELRSFFDGWKVLFYSESGVPGRSRRTARIIARRA